MLIAVGSMPDASLAAEEQYATYHYRRHYVGDAMPSEIRAADIRQHQIPPAAID